MSTFSRRLTATVTSPLPEIFRGHFLACELAGLVSPGTGQLDVLRDGGPTDVDRSRPTDVGAKSPELQAFGGDSSRAGQADARQVLDGHPVSDGPSRGADYRVELLRTVESLILSVRSS